MKTSFKDKILLQYPEAHFHPQLKYFGLKNQHLLVVGRRSYDKNIKCPNTSGQDCRKPAETLRPPGTPQHYVI